jgi:hypothetical protein
VAQALLGARLSDEMDMVQRLPLLPRAMSALLD